VAALLTARFSGFWAFPGDFEEVLFLSGIVRLDKGYGKSSFYGLPCLVFLVFRLSGRSETKKDAPTGRWALMRNIRYLPDA
jgi:hypothetical protein